MKTLEVPTVLILGIVTFGILLSIARLMHRQALTILSLVLLLPGLLMALAVAHFASTMQDVTHFFLAGILAAPLCLLPFIVRQSQRDPSSIRTGRGLGASAWQIFRLDVLPFYRRAIILTVLLTVLTCVACIV